jgi:LuxR family transcriptional regulator
MAERKRLMKRYMERLDEIAPLGFSAGLHIRYASPLHFESSYPQGWLDIYAENSFSLRDPLVFWGISKTGETRWSEIALPDPFGILKRAASFGLKYGAVASHGKITSRTIVGVARSDREFTDEEIAEVGEITRGLHEVSAPPADLTPAMVEALRLAGDGLRSDLAADRIGISEAAFEERLSSARARLGATTTAEALRTAREFKLI